MSDRDVLREVWNRACFGEGTGIGDRHLSAPLLVDDILQNSGPNHVADSGETAPPAAAAEDARYYRLDDVAALIEELPAAASDRDDDDAEDRWRLRMGVWRWPLTSRRGCARTATMTSSFCGRTRRRPVRTRMAGDRPVVHHCT